MIFLFVSLLLVAVWSAPVIIIVILVRLWYGQKSLREELDEIRATLHRQSQSQRWGNAVGREQPCISEEMPIKPKPIVAELATDNEPELPASIFSPITPESAENGKRRVESDRPELSSPELFIGRKVMLWAAMALFVLVATFFIKYAVDNHWLTDQMKVIGIALFGGLFLVAGEYFSRQSLRRLAHAVTTTGICIELLAGYASYAYFSLIPIQWASPMMVAIVITSFLLALRYSSRLIAVVAIFGGLAVPLLLRESDSYPQFFIYLLALNLGTVVLVNLMKRPPIALIAYFGALLEFWLWYGNSCHSLDITTLTGDRLTAALLFHVGLYLITLTDTFIASYFPRQRISWDDAVRAVVAPVIFGGTVWFFLRHHEIYGAMFGIYAFAFGLFYAGLATVFVRRLRRFFDPLLDSEYRDYWKGGYVAATVIAFVFVAAAIPLQLKESWIALGWYATAVALWIGSCAVRERTFYALSLAFHCLALGRFLSCDMPLQLSPVFYGSSIMMKMILNVTRFQAGYWSAMMIGSFLILGAVGWSFFSRRQNAQISTTALPRWLPAELNFNHPLRGGLFAVEGVLIITLFLSCQCWYYFTYNPIRFSFASESLDALIAHCSLAILWTLLASIIYSVGSVFRTPSIRSGAAVALLFVLLKCFFYQLFLRNTGEPLQFVPYLSPWFITIAGPMAVILIIAVIDNRLLPRLMPVKKDERIGFTALGVGALTMLWLLFSIECYSTRIALHDANADSLRQTQMTLSVLWSLFGGAMIAGGFIFRAPVLRWMAIILLGLTTMKLLCIDLQGLDQLYRIAAFFALAVVLFLIAWTYQNRR